MDVLRQRQGAGRFNHHTPMGKGQSLAPLVLVGDKIEADIVAILGGLLQRPVTVLDITEHQKNALASINIKTLGEALASTENDFMQADYIGPKRSRRIMNVVTSAVIEYLSG
jgi:DNA-directed RNA polymerase alpha subunit